jgi:putative Mn2+ efflux pump MntP
MKHITNPLIIGGLLVVLGVPLVWSFLTQLREEKDRRAGRKHLAAVNPVMYGHMLAKEKREKWSALFWTGIVLALGAVYVSFPEQVNYILAAAFAMYFVGLPMLLTWAWPVIAIVGLFVLVNALFPSKGA